jgi:uncharacterized protein (TIGR03437 family)
MTSKRILAACFAIVGIVAAAEPDGRYYFGMLEVTVGPQRTVLEQRNLSGTLLFDSTGGFTAPGGKGYYTARVDGTVLLSSPMDRATVINARLGAGGRVLLGAATESTGVLSLFVAVKAPSAPLAPSAVSGAYSAAALELSPSGGAIGSQLALPAAAITVDGDGTGTVSAPGIAGHRVYVSEDGEFLVGQPQDPARRGILLAARSTPGDFQHLYWLAELAVDGNAATVSIGSLAPGPAGLARLYQRSNTPVGSIDYRGTNSLALGANGAGALENAAFALAVRGSMLGGGPHSILIAVEASSVLGTGTFVNPHGIVNSASFSPPGDPVSPGSLVSLFGDGFPESEARVEVNGAPTKVIFASSGQINLVMPSRIEGASAVFVVRKGTEESAPAVVRVASTTPAVFSIDQSGTGAGIVAHADYSLVTPSAPARPGEVLLIFATGLGIEAPPPTVLAGGLPAEVLFAGPHSIYPGLYQINARLPLGMPSNMKTPLTLWGPDGYSDTVEIAVAP